jgi:hypothetical protein
MTTTWDTFHAIHAEVDPILDEIRRAEDAAWYAYLRRPDQDLRVFGFYARKNLIRRKPTARQAPQMGRGSVFMRGEGRDSGNEARRVKNKNKAQGVNVNL